MWRRLRDKHVDMLRWPLTWGTPASIYMFDLDFEKLTVCKCCQTQRGVILTRDCQKGRPVPSITHQGDQQTLTGTNIHLSHLSKLRISQLQFTVLSTIMRYFKLPVYTYLISLVTNYFTDCDVQCWQAASERWLVCLCLLLPEFMLNEYTYAYYIIYCLVTQLADIVSGVRGIFLFMCFLQSAWKTLQQQHPLTHDADVGHVQSVHHRVKERLAGQEVQR